MKRYPKQVAAGLIADAAMEFQKDTGWAEGYELNEQERLEVLEHLRDIYKSATDVFEGRTS